MNKNVVSVVVVISLLVGAVAGYFYGRQVGLEIARKEVKSVLDLAYPPPPDEVKVVSGKLLEVGDSSLILEIDDFSDYLPHTDNSPRKKISLNVTAPAAEISLVDYTKFDKSGNPATTKIDLSDLRVGDSVTVTANENIRKIRTVTAAKIELVKY